MVSFHEWMLNSRSPLIRGVTRLTDLHRIRSLAANIFITYVCLWFALSFLLFVLVPYEFQLRGTRSSSFHWLGLPIRRATIEVAYDKLRRHLLRNNGYRACDVDYGMLVLSLNFLRVTVRRGHDGSELTFRFPITLVVFFLLFGWAYTLITSQFAVRSLLEWAAVAFLVCFGEMHSQSETTKKTGHLHMQSLIQQLRKWRDSGANSHEELDAILSALVPLFLGADSETRSQIRHAVAGVRTLEDNLRNYAARAAISLHRDLDNDIYANVVERGNVPVAASDNDELFRLGLGALAIEDCADYRDSMTALAELCVRGEVAGISPRAHLEQLAYVFSEKRVGGFGNEERAYNVVIRDFRKSK